MPVIDVARRFVLTLDGEQTEYLPGRHEVSDAVATHWFTVPHLAGNAAPEPPPATYEQKLEAARQATHDMDPMRVPRPVEAPPSARDLMGVSGGMPDNAVYFAGGPQQDRALPGQVAHDAPPARSVGLVAARYGPAGR